MSSELPWRTKMIHASKIFASSCLRVSTFSLVKQALVGVLATNVVGEHMISAGESTISVDKMVVS